MHIDQISLEQCLDIRHKVLWPTLPREACLVEGDEQAQHFGLFTNNQLVSCLSLYILNDKHWQIRKFATLPDHQSQGYGTQLLNDMLARVANAGIEKVFLTTRRSAAGFYQKSGFHICSEPFMKNGIEFVQMQRCSDASLQ